VVNKIKIDVDMTAANLRSQEPVFEELASYDGDLLIDMNDVNFIDSSGVGGLIFLFKRLRQHGHTLKIIGVHGQPLQLILHLGLDCLLMTPLGSSPSS
jgi:anti-anti-sigma factor